MPVSATFARILAAGRPQFNSRVAEAKRLYPGFDSDAFAGFLVECVDPVITAVSDLSPDLAAPVALSAYDVALTLCSQGLVGPKARNSLVSRVWVELLPRLARPIAESPVKALGALSNAAVYLESNPGLRGGEWLGSMAFLASKVDTAAHLLALGKVLAWRSGAAHFRTGALLAADTLPEESALAAVGATSGSSWEATREKFAANPWWVPEGELPAGREVGDFVGFGGSFRQPPEVRASESGFWVKSGDRFSLLVADAWGAILLPATAEEFASPTPPAEGPLPICRGKQLVFPHRSVTLNLPAEGLAVVCNRHTAAVTSLYSHSISLFPL